MGFLCCFGFSSPKPAPVRPSEATPAQNHVRQRLAELQMVEPSPYNSVRSVATEDFPLPTPLKKARVASSIYDRQSADTLSRAWLDDRCKHPESNTWYPGHMDTMNKICQMDEKERQEYIRQENAQDEKEELARNPPRKRGRYYFSGEFGVCSPDQCTHKRYTSLEARTMVNTGRFFEDYTPVGNRVLKNAI